jgi:hypothetical protein
MLRKLLGPTDLHLYLFGMQIFQHLWFILKSGIFPLPQKDA